MGPLASIPLIPSSPRKRGSRDVKDAGVRAFAGTTHDVNQTLDKIRRLLDVLEPWADGEDPDAARRIARRILQRLDGMGKWGGYHTAFDHLARGFAGNDRALAFEVGEELVSAGLLSEKPSVGQRHVSLNPRKAGEIRNLRFAKSEQRIAFYLNGDRQPNDMYLLEFVAAKQE